MTCFGGPGIQLIPFCLSCVHAANGLTFWEGEGAMKRGRKEGRKEVRIFYFERLFTYIVAIAIYLRKKRKFRKSKITQS